VVCDRIISPLQPEKMDKSRLRTKKHSLVEIYFLLNEANLMGWSEDRCEKEESEGFGVVCQEKDTPGGGDTYQYCSVGYQTAFGSHLILM
jgi:hypothetical protein